MDVSIVVPVYNALKLTQECLASVYACGAGVGFEVIVVDNGSAADVGEWFGEEVKRRAGLRYLRYEEPLGFARSVNAGAAAATGDVLIVLNSDTVVTAGWMDGLWRVLMDDPSLGVVTPTTNHAGEPAQMDFSTVDVPMAKALALVAKRAASRQSGSTRVLYLPQRVTFFCAAIRRAVWEQFGGLDEAYGVGNFEDDDLCLRLRVAGYRIGVAQDVFVYHHNNATFAANKIRHESWMAKNAATFAGRARAAAEAEAAGERRWPKRSGREISVVVLPGAEGSLERTSDSLSRTLRSVANQTVADVEVIGPGEAKVPTGSWIAYVNEGDVLYPFHLEALLDAMERNGAESIFVDGWARAAGQGVQHPDAVKQIRSGPRMLAGWMHHASLRAEMLWEESTPMHWPWMTWEMERVPALAEHAAGDGARRGPVDVARSVYRRVVPLETRLALHRSVQRLLGRTQPDPEQAQLERLAAHLEELYAAGEDAGKFAVEGALPAVFLFNAITWSALTQRQQHFARGLGERGHTVFWMDPALSPARSWWSGRGLQQVAPGVHLVRLPGPARDMYTMRWDGPMQEATLGAMAAAVRQTVSAYGVGEAVMLVNYPRWQPLVARLHQQMGWKIASDLLDDQRALAGLYQTALFDYEEWLVEHSELVVTSSVVLQERLLPRETVLLHNAVDYALFSSAEPSGRLAGMNRPVVGFFGALADWLDMELIHEAAERYPTWSFVYIGPHTFSNAEVEVRWLRSTNLPNITVLPQMEPKTLAAHLAEFDVCTMPFLDIAVTRSMNPVKMYEYLAAGKPAVGRDLPELRHLAEGEARGLIELYRTPKEFFARLEAAVAEDSAELRERRRAFARENDWGQRVDVLSRRLVEMVGER